MTCEEIIKELKANASEKFWKLEERIKKDKRHPGVIIEMNKQDMIYKVRITDEEGTFLKVKLI